MFFFWIRETRARVFFAVGVMSREGKSYDHRFKVCKEDQTHCTLIVFCLLIHEYKPSRIGGSRDRAPICPAVSLCCFSVTCWPILLVTVYCFVVVVAGVGVGVGVIIVPRSL